MSGHGTAPILAVGTPILTDTGHAGWVRPWPDGTPAAVRMDRVPVILAHDPGTDYVCWPDRLVALR